MDMVIFLLVSLTIPGILFGPKVLGEKITKILNYQQQNKALVDKTKEVVSYNHKNVTTLVETGGTKDSDVFEQVLVAEVTTKGGSNGNN